MADKTVKELQEELLAANLRLNEADKFREQLAEANVRNAKLTQTAAAAGAAVAVEGEFAAKWTDAKTGKAKTKKVSFKDGHYHLFVAGKRLPTALVIKAANGKELKTDEALALQGLDKEGAVKHLTHLAKINYAYLK